MAARNSRRVRGDTGKRVEPTSKRDAELFVRRQLAVGRFGEMTDDELMAPSQDDFNKGTFTELRKAKPLLKKRDVVVDIESRFHDGEFGYYRRASLLTLTKSGSWLLEKCRDDRAFAVALAQCVDGADEYVKVLRGAANMIGEATARIRGALLCRADMAAVFAEARADDNTDEDEIAFQRFMRLIVRRPSAAS